MLGECTLGYADESDIAVSDNRCVCASGSSRSAHDEGGKHVDGRARGETAEVEGKYMYNLGISVQRSYWRIHVDWRQRQGKNGSSKLWVEERTAS